MRRENLILQRSMQTKDSLTYKRMDVEAISESCVEHNDEECDDDIMLLQLSQAIRDEGIAKRPRMIQPVSRPPHQFESSERTIKVLPHKRRRYQRRNSFVIHRKPDQQSYNILQGKDACSSSPALFGRTTAIPLITETCSQNASWGNASWARSAPCTNNAEDDTPSWCSKVEAVPCGSSPTIPQPLEISKTLNSADDEIMKAPDISVSKHVISSLAAYPAFLGDGQQHEKAALPVDLAEIREYPRTPRLLVSRSLQHELFEMDLV